MMKQALLLPFLLLLPLMCLGQRSGAPTPQNPACAAAMPQPEFQQALRGIENAPSEARRLAAARRLASEACLTAAQVKAVASLFSNDVDRLDFAKAAYPHTFNQAQFYDVYDAFAYFSNVFRLHDFVLEQRALASQPPGGYPGPQPGGAEETLPPYQYPDASQYRGPSYCQQPLSDQQFRLFFAQARAAVAGQAGPAQQAQALQAHIGQQCLTAAQAMRLASLLEGDDARLGLLEGTAERIYDFGQYYFAEQVLQGFVARQRFRQGCEQRMAQLQGGNGIPGNGIPGNGTPSGPGGAYPGQIAPGDFDRIKASVASETFNNTRLTKAKELVRARGRVFLSSQIKELVQAFDFESSRLEFAKYAYDFVMDPENFLLVGDVFQYSHSREQLAEYLRGR
jgi:hypothetical protein